MPSDRSSEFPLDCLMIIFITEQQLKIIGIIKENVCRSSYYIYGFIGGNTPNAMPLILAVITEWCERFSCE
jgi:hypothetical protein